jgi:ABC-2 type transport system ATP-binding protein
MQPIIEVNNLCRRFGAFEAVRNVSFQVREGEIFGLLGPNGAGKSTMIKMMVTLLKPSAGTVLIDGNDVRDAHDKVRKAVGIIFQDPSLDERLTAYENLYFHSRLYHISRGLIAERIEKALRLVDLWDRRNDLVMKFSGGMKRRLEIGRGILHTPKLLFLDEPTIGLDPQTRRYIWKYLSELRKSRQITIFLTTHYMEEAEICDRIAIMDHGELITLDAPANLKKEIGGDVVSLTTRDNKAAAAKIRKHFGLEVIETEAVLRMVVANGPAFLPKLFELIGPGATGADIKSPSLEDVFIKLTGREIRAEEASDKDKLRAIVKRRGRK